MNLILLYVTVGLGLTGFVVQRSKFLTVVIFFFTWTLMWTKYTADYRAYEEIYFLSEFRDGGYALLCMIGRWLGLTFFEFFMTLGAVALWLYCRFTLKYAYKNSLVAALYMLTISLFDLVQFRSFLAFAIVLSFLPCLFNPDRNKIILYVIGVVIATTIHLTMCFYIGFVFMNKYWYTMQNFKKIIGPLLLIIIAFIVGADYYMERAETLAGLYNRSVSNLTKWMVTLMLVGNAVFIHLWQRNEVTLELSAKQKTFAMSKGNVVTLMNVALIVLLPVALQSMTVMRLYKYMAIVNFAFISCHLAKYTNWRLLPQTLIIGLYGATYFVLFVIIHGVFFMRGVGKPIFMTNCFWPKVMELFGA